MSTKKNGDTGPNNHKRKKVLFVMTVFMLDVVAIWLLGEIVLRIIPIPGIYYNVYRYDPYVGGGLYPHTTEIYRDHNKAFVKRKVNR